MKKILIYFSLVLGGTLVISCRQSGNQFQSQQSKPDAPPPPAAAGPEEEFIQGTDQRAVKAVVNERKEVVEERTPEPKVDDIQDRKIEAVTTANVGDGGGTVFREIVPTNGPKQTAAPEDDHFDCDDFRGIRNSSRVCVKPITLYRWRNSVANKEIITEADSACQTDFALEKCARVRTGNFVFDAALFRVFPYSQELNSVTVPWKKLYICQTGNSVLSLDQSSCSDAFLDGPYLVFDASREAAFPKTSFPKLGVAIKDTSPQRTVTNESPFSFFARPPL